jgi:hypothetical protein
VTLGTLLTELYGNNTCYSSVIGGAISTRTTVMPSIGQTLDLLTHIPLFAYIRASKKGRQASSVTQTLPSRSALTFSMNTQGFLVLSSPENCSSSFLLYSSNIYRHFPSLPTHAVEWLVEALCYNSECHGFNSR